MSCQTKNRRFIVSPFTCCSKRRPIWPKSIIGDRAYKCHQCNPSVWRKMAVELRFELKIPPWFLPDTALNILPHYMWFFIIVFSSFLVGTMENCPEFDKEQVKWIRRYWCDQAGGSIAEILISFGQLWRCSLMYSRKILVSMFFEAGSNQNPSNYHIKYGNPFQNFDDYSQEKLAFSYAEMLRCYMAIQTLPSFFKTGWEDL